MIVVDYLQLMQSTSNYRGNKVQEITEISQNLKGIAKEMPAGGMTMSFAFICR